MHRSSNTIRLKFARAELLAKLNDNRRAHAAAYAAAIAAHREKLANILKRMLVRCADAAPLKQADQRIDLPIPEQHVEEYECALRMLEMTTEDEVTLSYDEFSQLVLDQWDWSRSFAENTMSYSGGAP